MARLSPAAAERQRAAELAWHRENLERISIDVRKGKRDIYKAKAAARGVSLARLITDYLDSLE